MEYERESHGRRVGFWILVKMECGLADPSKNGQVAKQWKLASDSLAAGDGKTGRDQQVKNNLKNPIYFLIYSIARQIFLYVLCPFNVTTRSSPPRSFFLSYYSQRCNPSCFFHFTLSSPEGKRIPN